MYSLGYTQTTVQGGKSVSSLGDLGVWNHPKMMTTDQPHSPKWYAKEWQRRELMRDVIAKAKKYITYARTYRRLVLSALHAKGYGVLIDGRLQKDFCFNDGTCASDYWPFYQADQASRDETHIAYVDVGGSKKKRMPTLKPGAVQQLALQYQRTKEPLSKRLHPFNWQQVLEYRTEQDLPSHPDDFKARAEKGYFARQKKRLETTRQRLRRARQKWRRFWRENWSKIATVLNKIGGFFLQFVPIVGWLIGPLLENAVQTGINSLQLIQQLVAEQKAVGKGIFEGFKRYMATAPDGVLGVIERIHTKYFLAPNYGISCQLLKRPSDPCNMIDLTSDPVVKDNMERFQQLLQEPEVKRLLELEDTLTTKDDAALEREADALSDRWLGAFVAVEKALDERFWELTVPIKVDPRPKFATGPAGWADKVQIRIGPYGDPYVRWIADMGLAPEGTVKGVWYLVSFSPGAVEAERASLAREAGKAPGDVPARYVRDWRTGARTSVPIKTKAEAARDTMRYTLLDTLLDQGDLDAIPSWLVATLKPEGIPPIPFRYVTYDLHSKTALLAPRFGLAISQYQNNHDAVKAQLKRFVTWLRTNVASEVTLGVPKVETPTRHSYMDLKKTIQGLERYLQAALKSRGIAYTDPRRYQLGYIDSKLKALGMSDYLARQQNEKAFAYAKIWVEDWPGLPVPVRYGDVTLVPQAIKTLSKLRGLAAVYRPSEVAAEAGMSWWKEPAAVWVSGQALTTKPFHAFKGALSGVLATRKPLTAIRLPVLKLGAEGAPVAPPEPELTPEQMIALMQMQQQVPVVEESKGLPTWAWILIGLGGVVALGGGGYLISRSVAGTGQERT